MIMLQKLDLTRHQMLHEGPLMWRLSRTKIELHVVLLEHILVLLQRQDEKFVLRCQSMTVVPGRDDIKFTYSPIIKLSNLLTRSVATGMTELCMCCRYHCCGVGVVIIMVMIKVT